MFALITVDPAAFPVTVKDAEVAPAGMLTVETDTEAVAGAVLDKVTANPPAGAGSGICTVPFKEAFSPTVGESRLIFSVSNKSMFTVTVANACTTAPEPVPDFSFAGSVALSTNAPPGIFG